MQLRFWQRAARPTLGAIGLVAGLTGAAHADSDRFTFEGPALTLVRADGSRVAGKGLIGTELTITDIAGPHRLRVDDVIQDPTDTASDVLLYRLSAFDPATGHWSNLCLPGPDGLTLAVPIPGYFTETGRYVPDPSRFTIPCTAGAFGKCVRFGYAPWKHEPDGTPFTELYQTCTRMVRADYCGNGHGYTRNGMMIDIVDRLGIQAEAGKATEWGMQVEAAWGPDGASCVNHVRVPENGSLDDVIRACPRLAGHVGPAACPNGLAPSDDPGALIVNKSAAQP